MISERRANCAPPPIADVRQFKMSWRIAFLPVLVVALAGCGATTELSEPHIAANAPTDKPISWTDLGEMDRAVSPYVAQARASYPEAKSRYLAGLPAYHSFFVTVPLRDSRGRVENVFLLVDRIEAGVVHGRIWNDLQLVQGYKYRQAYSVPEAEVMDWTITKPDGTEDGNFVGKYLDSLHDQRSQ